MISIDCIKRDCRFDCKLLRTIVGREFKENRINYGDKVNRNRINDILTVVGGRPLGSRFVQRGSIDSRRSVRSCHQRRFSIVPNK